MIFCMRNSLLFLITVACAVLLSACSDSSYPSTGIGVFGPPNMGGPTVEARKAKIASEPTGSFFYGRRYYVEKTRFWGYLRKPRQSANSAKLVVFNESKKRNPDRLPENGPAGQRYGYDNNYEYRIEGYYTGDTIYEVNSNQLLPEFMLTGFRVVDKNPGWLFTPEDHSNPQSITLIRR